MNSPSQSPVVAQSSSIDTVVEKYRSLSSTTKMLIMAGSIAAMSACAQLPLIEGREEGVVYYDDKGNLENAYGQSLGYDPQYDKRTAQKSSGQIDIIPENSSRLSVAGRTKRESDIRLSAAKIMEENVAECITNVKRDAHLAKILQDMTCNANVDADNLYATEQNEMCLLNSEDQHSTSIRKGTSSCIKTEKKKMQRALKGK